jgi:hypothetical protein
MLVACFRREFRVSYLDLTWRRHNVPITHRIPIRRTSFVQLPCIQPTKENHGVATEKKSRVKVRLGYMSMEREHEQVLLTPIPHQNAEKLTHSFYMGHHEPNTCTFQHGHAAILTSRTRTTYLDKTIDRLSSRPFLYTRIP